MKLYSLFLSGTLRWNLHPDEPHTFPAIADGNIVLLNPLVSLAVEPKPTYFRLANGYIHLLTNRLYIIAPKEIESRLIDVVVPWLRALRITAKQASLPTDVYGYGANDYDLADAQIELPTKFPKGFLFGKYQIDTALNAAAIAAAYELKSDASVPLYQELLLDALLACETRRSRETILYSAIALESLAKYELDQVYELALQMGEPPAHLNILNFDLPGGNVAKKDPIYALLSESDNFSRLLHEAPLYLLRRSLLRDSPDLFRQAKSLYSTRNRLGHGRSVTVDDEHLLPIDEQGAFEAVKIAISVFDWFGKPGYYAPDHDKVEIGG